MSIAGGHASHRRSPEPHHQDHAPPVLGVTADQSPPSRWSPLGIPLWVSPAQAARLIASGDLRPVQIVVAAAEPATAEAALEQLHAAGFTGQIGVLSTATDLTQTARTLQQLQTAIDNIPAPIFSKDADGVYGACNRAFEEYVGVPRDQIIGRTVHEIWRPELAEVYAAADRALIEAGGSQIYEAQVRYADGSVRDVTFYKGVFTDERGRVQGLSGALLDITERRALETELQRLADRDPLTGAANRALFSRQLEAAAARDDAGPAPAVLLIDLDDFKMVNDTLGHDVGDKLLVATTELLHRTVRAGDVVARLGGDEFAVLLEGLPAGEVDVLVRRILATLGEPVVAAGHALTVAASVGVAYARPGDRGTDLLRNADIALYVAKDAGKGQAAVYRPGMKARVAEQAALLDGLRQAVTGHQLHVEYQPIVRLADGRVTGVEALARWRHPVRGPVSPEVFIPVAERTGLIVPLGRSVLAQACRQASRWQRGGSPFATHVNVSAHQLRDPDFVVDLQKVLAETGLAPAGLVIEITETAMADDPQLMDTLRAIRALGVHVGLDDFGTGQSSLGILASCPVDLIKVDKSFVDRVTLDDRRAAVASAILRMADALDLHAIVEGVESAAQAQRLHDMGYRQAQGFHFARPLPPRAVDRLLRPR
ncbi:PAS domain S-box-containing protein/diguanylate cyclase (GGDEF) domain-containing protein [Micromonospora pattaloongensis]|uniref:PAS domain S-box-containing protein/diguanylate cyclase (GGDEF) domain-containing protein n=1 Tax=Micromonospora pattaloongensis TaxID=405436 RepID=A0A1H3NJ13_9ACTN|nr:bifunctional diguanylate cyclase/phosphodiesterase [Micromonospora pattaloongensis]SDY88907.1 PAS domain S-box-containing protein/diguanylate cyclase (GGDEF) domain-containing protein [Micromonospora pattaloongensis]